MHILTKLEPWVIDLLVDPIGKTPLSRDGDSFVSSYGRRYPICSGIPDLRPFVGQKSSGAGHLWEEGQSAFENWSKIQATQSSVDYTQELEGVREVYEAIPIKGRCLDVGGHQGRLRAFLSANQEYIVIDPFIDAFDSIEDQANLLKTYPFLRDPANFLCAVAEHVPFQENSFDTVHMRSVVDHFESPNLAMCEAYRVLRSGGELVIGLWVEGGKSGKKSAKQLAKDAIRPVLPFLGVWRFTDHHVWHPTYRELCALVESSGFKIDHVHWQSQWQDNVCYIRAIKVC